MKRVILAGVSAGAAVLLAACGSGSSSQPGTDMTIPQSTMGGAPSMHGSASTPASSPTSSTAPAAGSNNAADVTFATDMITHHRQAVIMAQMAAARSADAAVLKLAARIKAAQAPEITRMVSWLTAWKQPVPSTMSASMPGMGGASMPGMMSDAVMSRLASSKGSGFDKLFLTEMIAHHQGALTMARTELAAGSSSAPEALARSILAGQTQEIAEMNAMLAAM